MRYSAALLTPYGYRVPYETDDRELIEAFIIKTLTERAG
jgi:hypothetical protein